MWTLYIRHFMSFAINMFRRMLTLSFLNLHTEPAEAVLAHSTGRLRAAHTVASTPNYAACSGTPRTVHCSPGTRS